MLCQDAAMNNQQSGAAYEFSASAQPLVAAAWRGRFNIPRQNLNINIAAHISNKACLEVLEVASIMPESLCLEIIPRVDVWPASFKNSPPTEHSVALVFFPEGRDEEVFDSLLRYAICSDFALKAMIDRAELLIFTSIQLPEKLHRFEGRLYFWGVFKGQRDAASHQSGNHSHFQIPKVRLSLSANSCSHGSFEGKESPITTSSKHSPYDAWQHARPLDALRQKAECRYCGFVSSHGGISRLKAHLGGGHPRIRLPGCDKVSPEVKEVMADWFSVWAKKTKAVWTKEIRAHVDERERTLDASWERAKPLDLRGQKTDCSYFGFDGGISHHKVDLGGRDPKIHMEAWPKGSPEIKGFMSERVKKSRASISPETKGVMSEWAKSLTASRLEESQAGVHADRRGRPLDNAWEHANPLDEARQKTQCNYCGFVSSYGGISRLKAHLGGGCPQLQLQGCPHVSLEVKRMMEQWFNEWVKYSTATWTRKSHSKPSEIHAPAKAFKRGRPLDDTWEHAIPLDEMRQATKCKYCGFVSKRGGIARIRAHLGGGDLTMQLEDTQGTANETHWYEKRHHVLQETLDEIGNPCLKESIQKLIQEKNTNLQNMQFEIHSLKSRLASMP
ncbi:hypothetical protein DH2020_033826 [Rehmannia glutinosa]|uniref:BED-type domain-containing protein n=1 Tax=Rehmannia glutinosa TaxID=99300 RepID=A0ABR0VB66_REHGL